LSRIIRILKKEFLVIGRDIHAVGVLFVMPAVFILIMSLAMRDLFDIHAPARIDILVADRDGGAAAKEFLSALGKLDTLRVHTLDPESPLDRITGIMFEKDYKFAFVLTDRFSSFAAGKTVEDSRKPLTLLVNPTVGTHAQLVLRNILAGNLARMRVVNFVKSHEQWLALAGIDKEKLMEPPDRSMDIQYVYRHGQDRRIPSAVQQSVPAWLVFSMFFIVIPISNTFIAERSQGTFARLKSINVPRSCLLFGKMAPYFLINLIQVAIMILIGMYAVPLLGGTALTPGHSPGGLLLIAASVSFSSIAVALLIASIARTTEQATTIGGLLNIILGAVGGIMIPKFVMPDFMQRLSGLSPMSWGLEGFLDIFLRDGKVRDVLPESLMLLALGAAMLLVTALVLNKEFKGKRVL
jgi:ABC-2 type transport system permease protein